MDDQELAILLDDLESDRIERKASTSDGKKIRQAICAFANDLANHQKPGVLFIGVNDNGTCANLLIDDALLLNLAGIRSEGKILPFPVIQVNKRIINDFELAVVIVKPSDAPPVRYEGRTYIRVGPNLGAINRAALISADYVVVPLAPDLFSLQGLKNLEPTLRRWRKEWQERILKNPAADLALPTGKMQAVGYIVLQHGIRSNRPVKSFQRWIARIPDIYRREVIQQQNDLGETERSWDKVNWKTLKSYSKKLCNKWN
jgi:Putative DNA-binding domain/AAA domain